MNWELVLAHAGTLRASRPAKRWRDEARRIAAGGDERWLRRRIAEALEAGEEVPVFGLVAFIAEVHPDDRLLALVGGLCERSFRRVPGRGPSDQVTGNLCLYVLGACGIRGSAQLEAVLARARYPFLRRRLNVALDRIAETAGVERVDLEELTVPTYDLLLAGGISIPVGDGRAELAITGPSRVDLTWVTSTGRHQASVPAAMRRFAPVVVTSVRELRAEVRRQLSAQRHRIESLLAEDRTWTPEQWMVRYLEHPVVGHIARGLIWRVGDAERHATFMVCDGAPSDARGALVEIPAGSVISLWHPLEAGACEVRAWRVAVESGPGRQPFRQAHRETFRPRPEDKLDRFASRAFAGRVVEQSRLAALCRARGWEYTLQGDFFVVGEAYREIARVGLTAMLAVSPLERRGFNGAMDRFLELGRLVFVASGTQQPVERMKVPPRLFSEVSREVSLFSAIAGIADSQAWRTAPRALRRAYSESEFGPVVTSEGAIRRDLLARRLGDLRLGERLSVDDRSLVVRGELHDYRVHLDDGRTLIEPDGPMLSFDARGLVRPSPEILDLMGFQDTTLLSILATASLLAADAEIDDPLVYAQL